jgi:hypothetical protein
MVCLNYFNLHIFYPYTIRFTTNPECKNLECRATVRVIQTQNVSSFSIQFQIIAAAAMRRKNNDAAFGILPGSFSMIEKTFS